MTVIYYNTETVDKKYSIWPHGRDALPNGKYYCFNEKIDSPDAQRKEWDRIINMASVAKSKRKLLLQSEPFMVQISSVEALQAIDKNHFDKLIEQVTKQGGCVMFAKENAMISKDNSTLRSENKEFDMAMAQLEAKDVKTGSSKRVTLPNLPKRHTHYEI